jgi:tetratricopeptide (TPR) repeat protein
MTSTVCNQIQLKLPSNKTIYDKRAGFYCNLNLMKQFTYGILALLFALQSFAQPSFEDWETESKTNKRLLPRYGLLPKNEREIAADSSYIAQMMGQPEFKTRREASARAIQLGWDYYYKLDFKTAMYRFNQAYLLDSTNTDIYSGYGAIYMGMHRYDLASEQYKMGLSKDPSNPHLLTDLATYYLDQYYSLAFMPKSDVVQDPKAAAQPHLDSAISLLNRSYAIDNKDVNTAYKLSICYYNNGDCSNAWKYYDVAMALGGKPVTTKYVTDLKKRCPRKQ